MRVSFYYAERGDACYLSNHDIWRKDGDHVYLPAQAYEQSTEGVIWMAKMEGINIDLNMDTDKLQRKLSAIAKHSEALAQELKEIDADESVKDENIYISVDDKKWLSGVRA